MNNGRASRNSKRSTGFIKEEEEGRESQNPNEARHFNESKTHIVDDAKSHEPIHAFAITDYKAKSYHGVVCGNWSHHWPAEVTLTCVLLSPRH